MKKIINRLKKYNPPKYICFLYFFVPIFISCSIVVCKEEDIWFLLNHGKYLLNHGFPTIEPFTIHHGFSFVMQQWLSALIFYLSYLINPKYGLLLLIIIVNILILFFLYKLCMVISNNKYTISVIISCITDSILSLFLVPRPQIFTILLLVIVLYIMELFYKNKSTKSIYFLILISLLQINLHAAMWPIIYLFMLPYIVNYIYLYIKNRDKRLFKILGITVIMLLVQFINPYGIDSIKYIFNSYGNKYINEFVLEMSPPDIKDIIYGKMFYFLLGIIITIYMVYKKNRITLRHFLLFMGVTVLTIAHIRNMMLFFIGAIPFLACLLKDAKKDNKKTIIDNKEYKKIYISTITILAIICIINMIFVSPKFENDSNLESGINKILKTSNKKKIVLYTDYNKGSYAEFRGIKSYIDTRAEVFLKSNNKKEDIIKEYYKLQNGYIEYDKFIKKYKFTHMFVGKYERLYKYLEKNKEYKKIYSNKKYAVYKLNN